MSQKRQALLIQEAVGVHFSPIMITMAMWISISHVGVGRARQKIRCIITTAMAPSPMLHTLLVSQTHRVVSVRRGRITTTMATSTSILLTVLSVMVLRMSYIAIMAMAPSRIPQLLQVSQILGTRSAPLGGITIRMDISTCMSSTMDNPMCFTAITAMAPSPMSPRRPV